MNICKQLVELMGGRIEVAGEKNRGSTFSFSMWVGICEDEEISSQTDDVKKLSHAYVSAAGYGDSKGDDPEDARIFGTPANKEVLKRNMSKLILCVEMENWEKAEMFMDTVRQLTEEAPWDVKRVALRLKMAIQKENYEKVTAEFEELNSFL